MKSRRIFFSLSYPLFVFVIELLENCCKMLFIQQCFFLGYTKPSKPCTRSVRGRIHRPGELWRNSGVLHHPLDVPSGHRQCVWMFCQVFCTRACSFSVPCLDSDAQIPCEQKGSQPISFPILQQSCSSCRQSVEVVGSLGYDFFEQHPPGNDFLVSARVRNRGQIIHTLPVTSRNTQRVMWHTQGSSTAPQNGGSVPVQIWYKVFVP